MTAARVNAQGVIPPQAGSELGLETIRLGAGAAAAAGGGDRDALLFVFAGGGTLAVGGEEHVLAAGSAALAVAGEEARLTAGPEGLAAVCASIGSGTDRHAPIGPRATAVPIELVEAGNATGKRSFQVLFGPHNGSARATLFVGYIPPGSAPWHYHFYDEIVWVWRGAGRFHIESGVEELAPGSAFRLSPREVHIVENLSADTELAVLGIFTPAGSPAAAYLPA
jgi:quercetin dioxygenase-like cupin family protein